jgi:hypothetical protein
MRLLEADWGSGPRVSQGFSLKTHDLRKLFNYEFVTFK